MDGRIVIIGAGQAGVQAAISLRGEGWTGPITLVGDEPHLPYQRPPLSKAYLSGELPLDRLVLRPEGFFAEQKIVTMLGVHVTEIDRAARTVALGNGALLPYDALILTTGTRARTLPLPGADLGDIFTLRTTADSEALGTRLTEGKRLAVIGAGYIGLEVAAVARKRGANVTVLEAAPRVMARTASPVVSRFYETEHRSHGVDIRLNQTVTGFAGEAGFVRAVQTAQGEVAADLVLVGVGALPNEEIARAAGLPCDGGIEVDVHGRTADPAIWAAGDCTNHPCALAGRRLRLESVQNAIDQAKHVALALTGKAKDYAETPWFWSDQYDLKLQIAGLPEPDDDLVLRGDPAARKFAVFHARAGVVTAVEAVNAAPEYMVAKKMIGERARLDAAKLSDTSVSIKDIAAAAASARP